MAGIFAWGSWLLRVLLCSCPHDMYSSVYAGTPPPRDGVSLTATGMALTLMVFSIFCLRAVLHGVHAWLVSFTGDSTVFPIILNCLLNQQWSSNSSSLLTPASTHFCILAQAYLAGCSGRPLAGWTYLTACVRWSSASGCWSPLIQPWATWLPLPLMFCQVQISPLFPLQKCQTVMLLMAPGQSAVQVRVFSRNAPCRLSCRHDYAAPSLSCASVELFGHLCNDLFIYIYRYDGYNDAYNDASSTLVEQAGSPNGSSKGVQLGSHVIGTHRHRDVWNQQIKESNEKAKTQIKHGFRVSFRLKSTNLLS